MANAHWNNKLKHFYAFVGKPYNNHLVTGKLMHVSENSRSLLTRHTANMTPPLMYFKLIKNHPCRAKTVNVQQKIDLFLYI